MKRLFSIVMYMFIISYSPCVYSQETIGLKEYLKQVETGNHEYKAARLSEHAMELKSGELDSVYLPYFNAGINSVNDKSGSSLGSTIAIEQLKTTVYNIGLNKKYDTGTTLGFGYSQSNSDILLSVPYSFNGVNISAIQSNEIKPFVSIDQSLLKDWGGKYTRAGINKTKLSMKAGQYFQILAAQQILLKAKLAYFNLTLARETVLFRRLSLERAEKTLKLSENRVKNNFSDKNDLIQAQAGYGLRQLNLQQALEAEQKTVKDFNLLRNENTDTPVGELQTLSDIAKEYAGNRVFERTGRRADVLAAQLQYESAKLAELESGYRSAPEVNISGTASLHGLDPDFTNLSNSAQDQINSGDKPTYTVGLNFSMPIGVSTINRFKNGYREDTESAKETLDKTTTQEEKEWKELLLNWENNKKRSDMVVKIKNLQEERVRGEQEKLSFGRTTTFQVLSAENDLDDAILMAYGMTMEKLSIAAQSVLYDTKQ